MISRSSLLDRSARAGLLRLLLVLVLLNRGRGRGRGFENPSPLLSGRSRGGLLLSSQPPSILALEHPLGEVEENEAGRDEGDANKGEGREDWRGSEDEDEDGKEYEDKDADGDDAAKADEDQDQDDDRRG